MLKRVCSYCGRRVQQGQACACLAERRRIYDTQERDAERASFYKSAAWRAVAAAAKARALGIDELLFAETGEMRPGAVAHHIAPLDEVPHLRLRLDNIIYLSAASHKRVHDEYQKSYKAKKRMQARLRAIRRGGADGIKGLKRISDAVAMRSRRMTEKDLAALGLLPGRG